MKFLIQGVVMSKIFIIFIFSMLLNIQPIFSQTNNLNMSVGNCLLILMTTIDSVLISHILIMKKEWQI